MQFDTQRGLKDAKNMWEGEGMRWLKKYARIRNVSPGFDPKWRQRGHMMKAMLLYKEWAEAQPLQGITATILEVRDRTPLLLIDVPGTGPGEIRSYGHLDKQPGMEKRPGMRGWDEGLGPWKAVRRDDRLYGRGVADDGYAMFASLMPLRLLANQGLPYPHSMTMVEAAEESASPDMPYWLLALEEKLGDPDIVICLDSGVGDYERLWDTRSLRGVLNFIIRVDVLEEAIHSGDATGIVPSSFDIACSLLSRLRNQANGKVRLHAFHVAIPAGRRAEARKAAEAIGDNLFADWKYPWAGETRPLVATPYDGLLARTWRPTLAVIGVKGPPSDFDQAGNVVLPFTELKVSMRIPPGLDAEELFLEAQAVLEEDPPYSARVICTRVATADGWNAPPPARWFTNLVNRASKDVFGASRLDWGEGGTIPFMPMFEAKFPRAQLLVTGVLGPQSNAHAPNEFLNISYVEKLDVSLAHMLGAFTQSRF